MLLENFGKFPSGERLERIRKSPHYKDGKFQNLSNTPSFGEGYNVRSILYEKLFRKFPRVTPVDPIPAIKTNLHNLDINKNILVWFGHSSYFLQVEGLRFLIDPVFSGHASPLPGTLRSFRGSDVYSVADMPGIDFLLITHDHYDHVDHETLVKLKPKVRSVICGLGVGSHLEYWGYDAAMITEKDWYSHAEIKNDVVLFIEPTRHFSGRGFKRNNTLWVSFVLKSPTLNLYLGGDSGYESHFADIGQRHGPFDLAILENGQYNKMWPYIHLTPEQFIKAAHDLGAKRAMPVHNSKFALSNHPWDDPMRKVTALNETNHVSLVTPVIGQLVRMDDPNQKFGKWWEGVE